MSDAAVPGNLRKKEIYVDRHGRETEPEHAERIIVLWCTPSGSVVRRQEFVVQELAANASGIAR